MATYEEVTCSNGKNVDQLLDNLIELERRSTDYGGYRPVGAFKDTTTQIPTGNTTDALTPVLFGPALVSGDGVIGVDVNGVFTNLKKGYWFLKARARAKRTGASGTSELFFQFYKRITSTDPWLPLGESIDVELDNSKQTEIVLDESFFYGDAGNQFYLGWARSSNGDNSGQLVPGTPTPALVAAGVQVSPSAQATIFTMADYKYV